MHSSKLLITAMFSITVMMLASCSDKSSDTPTESVISAAIEDSLKAGVDVSEIRFKVFPNEQDSSRGRISIGGTLITTEERVESEKERFSRLRMMALKRGITQEQWVRYGRNSGLLHRPGVNSQYVALYEVILPAGSEIDFTSEQMYTQTIDGFELKGKVSYDISGTAVSELATKKGLHLVYGTPEFEKQFSQLMGWHEHETQTLPTRAQELFGRLANGGKIVDGQNVLAYIEPFKLKTEGWSVGDRTGSDGRYYSAYTSKIPVTINALTDLTLGWINIAKGKNDAFNVELILDYKNPQPKTACLSLKAREGLGHTGVICWNGSMWKWDGRQYGGMIESRTKKQLNIVPSESNASTTPATHQSVSPTAVSSQKDDSVTASKVSEGINFAGPAKLAVEETFESKGNLPSVGNNPDANAAYGLPAVASIVGTYTSGLAILDSGVIRITYDKNLGAPSANGHTILVTPKISNNKIVEWDCSGGTMPTKYRPLSCR